MSRKSSKFFNVHTIERPEGLGYGYFVMEQFNDHGYPNLTDDERKATALTKAEELAAKGQPVVVREGHRGMGGNVLIWQSFNSKDQTGLLQQ